MALATVERGIYSAGEFQYQVRIRRQGQNITRTFESLPEARRFRDITIGRVVGDDYTDNTAERETTLLDLINRYEAEVSVNKKGHRQEVNRFLHLRKEAFSQWKINTFRRADIKDYRDRLRKSGKSASTVNNYINLLSAVFKHAISDFGLNITNPVAGVKRLPVNNERSVSLSEADEAKLLAGCERSDFTWLPWLVKLALATGLRAGELRALKRDDAGTHTIFVRDSKNNESRHVPLTVEAEELVAQIKRALPLRNDNYLFFDPEDITANKLTTAFRRACKRAKIVGVTFHDLRHVAITRLAPLHRDALHLSKTSGHKTVVMLKRYFNPTGEEMAEEIRLAARVRARILEEDRVARGS